MFYVIFRQILHTQIRLKSTLRFIVRREARCIVDPIKLLPGSWRSHTKIKLWYFIVPIQILVPLAI